MGVVYWEVMDVKEDHVTPNPAPILPRLSTRTKLYFVTAASWW